MSYDQPPHNEKPVGYYDKPMSFWQRIPCRSDTGGVVPMFLEGREKYMQERMRGMTPERRAWRKQWLHDQVLSHREPVDVPQLYTELNNPIRRFFCYPFRQIELALKPKVGREFAYLLKCGAQLFFWFVPAIYVSTFIGLYLYNDWTRVGGIRQQWAKPIVQPDDPNYPFVSTKVFDDYFSLGFKYSPYYKTPEQIRAEEAKSR